MYNNQNENIVRNSPLNRDQTGMRTWIGKKKGAKRGRVLEV